MKKRKLEARAPIGSRLSSRIRTARERVGSYVTLAALIPSERSDHLSAERLGLLARHSETVINGSTRRHINRALAQVFRASPSVPAVSNPPAVVPAPAVGLITVELAGGARALLTPDQYRQLYATVGQ